MLINLNNYQITSMLQNLSGSGLFINDIHFFYFELFFLFSIFLFLIFFVFLSNISNYKGSYFKVSDSLLNLLFFVIIVLLILLNNNSNFPYYIFNGFYFNDGVVLFFKNVILIFFFFYLLLLKNYSKYFSNYDFEFIIILLISLFSGILILNSNDFISLFFILELQTLSFYIIVASRQTSSFSTESGLKYFILGSFSSGIMLFGISLIYGFTGLLNFNDLSLFTSSLIVFKGSEFNLPFLGFIFGFTLFSVGLIFKFGAAPFHMWLPDVYEGAPLVITAYLSIFPKISLIYIFIKLYYQIFFDLFFYCQIFFIIVAVFSIAIGSVAAIYQIKLKRLLTYSMITNSGYLILSIALSDFTGVFVTIFYFLSYIFIMLGLFFCFFCLRDRSSGLLIKKITTLTNLLEVNPYLSFSLLVLLFSIAGIPPILGFYGKMFLFMFALKLKTYWVAFLFVIFSALSVFYYIRLVKLMYFNRTNSKLFLVTPSFNFSLIIAFITIVNCFFFINPNLIFKLLYNVTLFFYI